MNAHPHSFKRPRSGFTLLEVLVVLALLSVIMVALGSALRTTAQTEQRIDSRIAQLDEVRVAQDFLRNIIGKVSARKKQTPLAVGENPYLFAGSTQEMRWVGIMPARYGVGGRFHFKLSTEAGKAQKPALVIRYVPWTDDAALPDWGASDSYTLVPDVVYFQIQYRNVKNEPAPWVSTWESAEQLPSRIKLVLQSSHGSWPQLIIPMRLTSGSDPSAGGPSFGARK